MDKKMILIKYIEELESFYDEITKIIKNLNSLQDSLLIKLIKAYTLLNKKTKGGKK